jgi:hypothetical protein
MRWMNGEDTWWWWLRGMDESERGYRWMMMMLHLQTAVECVFAFVDMVIKCWLVSITSGAKRNEHSLNTTKTLIGSSNYLSIPNPTLSAKCDCFVRERDAVVVVEWLTSAVVGMWRRGVGIKHHENGAQSILNKNNGQTRRPKMMKHRLGWNDDDEWWWGEEER